MVKDYTISALITVTPEDIKETYGFEILYKYAQKYPNDENILGYVIEICRKLMHTEFL